MARKFNPKKVVGSYKVKIGTRDVIVSLNDGFMDGTHIEIAFDEKAVTTHVGNDGTVTFVLNPNQKMMISVTFAQGAPQNEALSALVPNAFKNYMPVGSIVFEDLNGTFKAKGPEAVVEQHADAAFGNNVQGRKWTFIVAQGELNVGAAGDF